MTNYYRCPKCNGTFAPERVAELAAWLNETSDRLNEFLLSNNFYKNTFERAVKEVTTKITKVMNKMPLEIYAK